MKLPFTKHLFLVGCVVVVALAAFLRLYKLESIPSSLYWEEAALGYDAYSILKTGKDHHGNAFPVVAFTSFGDFKPSGYFYAIVPFISLFGLNELSVRLPSAIAGIATVVGIGFLVRYLSQVVWPQASTRFYRLCFVVGMLIATLSAWLIQFSRGAWEVNLASSLLLWSVVTGLTVIRTKNRKTVLMFSSVVFAALSMYVYHATRVVAPAVLAAVFTLWVFPTLKDSPFRIDGFFKSLKSVILPGLCFVALITPLLLSSLDQTTNQRFAETSITSDGEYVKESNRLRELAGNTLLSNLFTHRYIILSQQVATAFLSHFTPNFLFVTGDTNPRHSTGFTGIMAAPDALWLVIGVVTLSYAFLRKKTVRGVILLLTWWLLIGILPAAITKAHPHALRILPTAPVFMAVLSIGLLQTLIWLKRFTNLKIFTALLVGIIVIHAGFWLNYWRFYTNIYPTLHESDWQYGYEQMVNELNTIRASQPSMPIYVTREYGRPAMYYWFYTQTPPTEVQAEDSTARKDQGEFLTFKNISFINTVNEAQPGIIVSSSSGYEQLSKKYASVQKLGEIRGQRGQVVWVLSQIAAEPPSESE